MVERHMFVDLYAFPKQSQDALLSHIVPQFFTRLKKGEGELLILQFITWLSLFSPCDWPICIAVRNLLYGPKFLKKMLILEV